MIFTLDVFQFIVDSTNEYARHRFAEMSLGPRSLYTNWKAVTLEEMKGFIGIIINMGIIQLQDLKDYWSRHETLDLHFFPNIMTRDRFFQIFNMLHVGSINSNTKRDKIQPLLDKIINNLQKLLTPQNQLSIDEAMISFRGRVGFKQYIKDKPNPWGIKAYVLSESVSGYVCNVVDVLWERDINSIKFSQPNH